MSYIDPFEVAEPTQAELDAYYNDLDYKIFCLQEEHYEMIQKLSVLGTVTKLKSKPKHRIRLVQPTCNNHDYCTCGNHCDLPF